ncbi:hypothetical protein N657DRAFT_682673 [Parathielavia appendiculata]|uniref:Uncharacterized protein n=1 Tax=Parathielavia appendiculata TaxID=2587402 RepID=A0AAN6Z1J8_9PEZI|nr:hypothetical protein N657DRAFT_682673 [Parathielavia appendiculata]
MARTIDYQGALRSIAVDRSMPVKPPILPEGNLPPGVSNRRTQGVGGISNSRSHANTTGGDHGACRSIQPGYGSVRVGWAGVAEMEAALHTQSLGKGIPHTKGKIGPSGVGDFVVRQTLEGYQGADIAQVETSSGRRAR